MSRALAVATSFRTRLRRSELAGLPTLSVFLADQRRTNQRARRDPQNQDDKRQDPHQQAETLGFRGEQNPFAVFGDKKIFDLLRSFSRLQLLADNAAHLLGHFRRRVRNREILADHTAQLLRDGPCLIVDIRRVGRPHRTHDQKIKNDEKQSNEHEIIEWAGNLLCLLWR